MTDLFALTATLRRVPDAAAGSVAATGIGRALNAWAYDLIDRQDPALAAEVHDVNGAKPFHIAAWETRDGWRLFLAGLERRVSRVLAACAPGRDARLRFAGMTFEVTGDPATREHAYSDLASARLFGEAEASRATGFHFLTPTGFRSEGRNVPLPLPGHIFGSLLDRWERFAPFAIHPDTRRYAEECLLVSRYQLQTVTVQGEGREVGFTGYASFWSTRSDQFWLRNLHTLAAFAELAGIGQKAAMGMGHVLMMRPRERVA